MLSASNSLITVVLGRLAGTGAVGLFQVGSLPTTVSGLAGAPLQLVMFAEMAKLSADGRKDELRRIVIAWTRLGFAIAGPAVVAGFFLLPVLIPAIYGDAFKGAVATSQIMLIPAFVGFAFGWMKNFLAVMGRPQVGTMLGIIPLTLSVPLTALLADHGSIAGAVGVAVPAVLMCVGNLIVTRRWFRQQQNGSGMHEPPIVAEPEEKATVFGA
jgi:O-antigen/teichoic acid export membrane protein